MLRLSEPNENKAASISEQTFNQSRILKNKAFDLVTVEIESHLTSLDGFSGGSENSSIGKQVNERVIPIRGFDANCRLQFDANGYSSGVAVFPQSTSVPHLIK